MSDEWTIRGGVCGRCGGAYLYRVESGDPGHHTNPDRCDADRDGVERRQGGLGEV